MNGSVDIVKGAMEELFRVYENKTTAYFTDLEAGYDGFKIKCRNREMLNAYEEIKKRLEATQAELCHEFRELGPYYNDIVQWVMFEFLAEYRDRRFGKG